MTSAAVASHFEQTELNLVEIADYPLFQYWLQVFADLDWNPDMSMIVSSLLF